MMNLTVCCFFSFGILDRFEEVYTGAASNEGTLILIWVDQHVFRHEVEILGGVFAIWKLDTKDCGGDTKVNEGSNRLDS